MWKDLTLQEKAEIMKMSVANGVTDINDIQQLYDGSVGHRFDDAGRIITLADLPREYVQKYGHINVVTPKGVRMSLSQAYRDYNQTPININDVPDLTDYLIKQDQPDISEQAHIDKVAADRFVHQLGEERDKALIGLAASITGGGALASGLALAPVATISSTIGGIAGEKLFNTGYKKFTGNNWGQDIETWTNGYIPAEYGEYLNPGTLIGGIVGTKLPIPKWKNLESNGILSDWLNIKNWKLNSSPIITAENAATVPDKMWDRAYFQAIKDENLPEVQRLRDLHFKVKSNTQILNDRGEPQIIYHGSSSKFNKYDPSKFGSATDNGWYGKGLYGSSSKNIAEDYADPYLYKFYVNSQNPYKIGFWNEEFTPYALNDYSQSSRRTHLAEFFNRTPDDLQRKLLKRWYHDDFFLDRALADMQRHDSVVQSMMGDPLKPKKIRAKYAEIVVPKPEQLKLADAITYDDTGRIIPISKRDNFTKKDFRYSLLLPFLGMGAIASTNKFGGNLYKGGGNKQQLGIIDSILTRHGVNYTKTSGYRGPNSKVGKLGSKSAHARTLSDGSSAAIDIVPGPGSSWDKLYAQMSSPEVRADLAKYGLDILDETSASTMKKTRATGKHFHVGKGIKGQQGKGVFVNQNNSTISAYHKMYGKPDLSISNDVLYNPAQELKWTNITPTIQQTPWYNNVNSNLVTNDFTPQVKPITPAPIEERFPIEDLPDIAPLLSSILPDQRMPSYQQVTVPTYQSPIINFDEPYLLFGK